MHRVQRRQDQDIRPDRHALRVCRNVAHDRRDLQHLHRMGQPVMREPEGGESGITRRAHLSDHFRDAFREVEALRELRVDEQADFHDRLFPPRLRRAAYSGYARLNRVGHRPGSLARIVQYYYWTILKYSKLVLYILSIRTADAREGTSFPAFGDHLLPARSP